jgi:hypothetical protein
MASSFLNAAGTIGRVTISERIEAGRRERRVLAWASRAAWRLEQAERERTWALASALAEGALIRTLAGAWLVRTVQSAAMNLPSNSGNVLLVFGCECSVSGTHRNSAAEGGQLPGLPEGRMPAGLVLIHGRAHGARIAAQPAEAVGARCTPPGQIPGLAAADAAAVTR